MTFDEWITHLFDRPVTESSWWKREDDFGSEPAEAVVQYMTRLFLNADTILAPFSDAQVAQGLYAVISNALTEYSLTLTDTTVPRHARLECLEAMTVLFERFFAVRCSPHLSHLDTAESGTPAHVSPLNGVCYMWWDVLPVHGITHNRPDNPDGPALDHAIFSVIWRCLEIDSVACQESALLGLMEWSPYDDETGEIAADYIRRNPSLRPELQAFAWKVA